MIVTLAVRPVTGVARETGSRQAGSQRSIVITVTTGTLKFINRRRLKMLSDKKIAELHVKYANDDEGTGTFERLVRRIEKAIEEQNGKANESD
mgnify:CR=1 FL=1